MSTRKKKIKSQLKKTQEPKEMEKEQVEFEKRDLKDLARDIVASYDTRVRVVGGIIDDTHKMMADFRGKREDMSKDLREALATRESLRKKDFDRMMEVVVMQQNKREGEVKKMLEDFRKEEETVAEKLRNLLKKGEDLRLCDFKKMMADIRQAQEVRTKETSRSITDELEKMRGEVYAMLDNFKKERYSVASAWHEILGLFRREKAGAELGNPGNSENNPPPEEKQN